MNRRMLIAGFLAILGMALAFLFLSKRVENDHPSSQGKDKRVKARPEVTSIPHAKSPATDPNEKVRMALVKFKDEQARIPNGAAVEQLAALKERTAELQKIETPLPSMTQESDENGIKWKRLAYPSGEIRYELAE